MICRETDNRRLVFLHSRQNTNKKKTTTQKQKANGFNTQIMNANGDGRPQRDLFGVQVVLSRMEFSSKKRNGKVIQMCGLRKMTLVLSLSILGSTSLHHACCPKLLPGGIAA